MIVHKDRRPAPKRTKSAIWVLDALHPNLLRQLRNLMGKSGFAMEDFQESLSVESVMEQIRGKEINFVHDRLRPALSKLGPRLKVKHRSLQGKFILGDTVLIIPAVGKDGEWKSRRPSLPGRATKSSKEEIKAYYFRVVSR